MASSVGNDSLNNDKENCICSFETNNGNLFSHIVRGGGRGKGLLNL